MGHQTAGVHLLYFKDERKEELLCHTQRHRYDSCWCCRCWAIGLLRLVRISGSLQLSPKGPESDVVLTRISEDC
jgi:hypothetical protein